ncbi:MAG TPA: nickel pincer cofactor biosynthesis protein LarB [Planctomycetota bacterium]|nr:nickel pincer cofactor biosynthesis protein LarB [Planctomycetota bacterium]
MRGEADEAASLRALLEQVRAGERTVDDAFSQLCAAPRADLGFATIDHDRTRRCGFPEVVFCEGKTPDDAADIAAEILTRADRLLMTRADHAQADAVLDRVPVARHHVRARCITVQPPDLQLRGLVAVVSAGTADLPVAEEVAVTLGIAGNRVEQFTDIGVAGLHRLLARIDAIREANAIVVCAGMEGALPSVVAGLVDKPVIAVPTSVGYGAAFGGIAALLGMLNSCAAGVAVVNIDNGFGAGYLASQINLRSTRQEPR